MAIVGLVLGVLAIVMTSFVNNRTVNTINNSIKEINDSFSSDGGSTNPSAQTEEKNTLILVKQ